MEELKGKKMSVWVSLGIIAGLTAVIGLLISLVAISINNFVLMRVCVGVSIGCVLYIIIASELSGYVITHSVKKGKTEVTKVMMNRIGRHKTIVVPKLFYITTYIAVVISIASSSFGIYSNMKYKAQRFDSSAMDNNIELCGSIVTDSDVIYTELHKIYKGIKSDYLKAYVSVSYAFIQAASELGRLLATYKYVGNETLEEMKETYKGIEEIDMSEEKYSNMRLAKPENLEEFRKKLEQGNHKLSQLQLYGVPEIDVILEDLISLGKTCDSCIDKLLMDGATVKDMNEVHSEIENLGLDKTMENARVLADGYKRIALTRIVTLTIAVLSALYIVGHIGDRKKYLAYRKAYVEKMSVQNGEQVDIDDSSDAVE